MPELRKDPVSGRWVIIATERAQRPQIATARRTTKPTICPFCPGHEERTPPEILAYRPASGPAAQRNAPGWSVRVFPNKHPALMIEGELERAGDGVYDWMQGIGAHEVVVETPDHGKLLHQLPASDVERVLAAWRDRMADLRNDRRFRYVLAFKNHGLAAGATLDHSHSQLIALPTVPKVVADEIANAREYHALKERCLFCDIVRQEITQRVRVVHENADFLVFEPYAPRFPFETWVIPRRHRTAFESSSQGELLSLADALRTALGKLHRALDDPPWNLAVHTAPLSDRDLPHYHWHIEIMPAVSQVAGFEMGSGFHINPTPPEEAARFLRELPPIP